MAVDREKLEEGHWGQSPGARRQVEVRVSRVVIDGGCLLCSEPTSKECHRRLVAEYLRSKWGDLEIQHL
jgi:hypothetical protein